MEIIFFVGGGRGAVSTGDRFRDVRPKWVNPCGGILDDSGVDPDAPLLEDSEIAANAILDVDIALSQIESFKDDFVSCVSFIIHLVKVVVVVLEGCCCISSPSQKFFFSFWVFRMSLTYPSQPLGYCFSRRIIENIPWQCHTDFRMSSKKFEKRCHEKQRWKKTRNSSCIGLSLLVENCTHAHPKGYVLCFGRWNVSLEHHL